MGDVCVLGFDSVTAASQLVHAAVQHHLHKPAQLRSEILLRHREAPIAILDGVNESIWCRSGGSNVLRADAHQQIPDLRPLRIGVEIQLPDLGRAGETTATAYSDSPRLVRRSGLSRTERRL